MKRTGPKVHINKIGFFMVGTAVIAATLILRLFQLQVIAHNYYQEIATKEQYGYVELPAQRGEIIIEDYHSDEEFLIATNTTLNLLYADPVLIKDPFFVAEKIAPLTLNIEEERAKDNERIEKLSKNLSPELTKEEIGEILKPLTDAELTENFKQELIEKISQRQRPEILLATDLEETPLKALASLSLPGIGIIGKDIYAYPPQILNPQSTAEKIADHVQIPAKKLENLLRGENRYVILRRKLDPEVSDQILEIISADNDEMFRGLGLNEEYYRYYPEGQLAANVLGYVSRDNVGQYGIESTFNTQLQGVAGKFQTKKDSVGRQITVGESVLTPAVDGDDIVLTIDRSVQLKVEQILAQAVYEYNATSGQVLIMNPKTGEIIAMAHVPTYDPNNYGDVFKKVEVRFSPEDIKNLYPSDFEGIYYFYTNLITLDKYTVFEEIDENGVSTYYKYENIFGPEVYHNKAVSWPYEPG
ncbi:MAG: hypothetical protein V1679_00460, partial [Candidatus Peregrinibacteria bacterium]